jgi:rhamnosyltransferase
MTIEDLHAEADGRKVAALVVTYFPDMGFPARLERLLAQVDRVVVVDNGSDPTCLAWKDGFARRRGVTIIENGRNLGIADALNRGMSLLAGEGYDWVLTMDQDSEIEEGFVAALLLTLSADSDLNRVAMVGSNRRDEGTDLVPHRWLRPKKGLPFFERVPCNRIRADGVTLVITSGTLTSVKAFQRLGPFEREFFIDLVDFEYCLRARRAGYRILVSEAARMSHRVGAKRQSAIAAVTLSPMHHGPLRKYYIFRNGVHVMRAYGAAFPHWLVYQLLAMSEIIIGVFLFEDRKASKLRACLAGVWDGLLGRKGPAQRAF